MNKVQKLISYYNNNPEGYWFKNIFHGWVWLPVKLQGWFVVFISIVIFISGIYVSEIDDAPGAVLIGFLLMFAIIHFFGRWKGEKIR